jgi:hypothetical protein
MVVCKSLQLEQYLWGEQITRWDSSIVDLRDMYIIED